MKLRPGFGTQVLTVNQFETFPPENGNLIAPASDLHRLTFRVHADAVVDVVDAAAVPDAAVAIQLADAGDSFLSCPQLVSVVSHLPAAFVRNDMARLQSQPVILLQFANCPDVNHVRCLLHLMPNYSTLAVCLSI